LICLIIKAIFEVRGVPNSNDSFNPDRVRKEQWREQGSTSVETFPNFRRLGNKDHAKGRIRSDKNILIRQP
jgi:hypothetical protein